MYALYLFPFCSTGQRFTDHISSGTLQSLARGGSTVEARAYRTPHWKLEFQRLAAIDIMTLEAADDF